MSISSAAGEADSHSLEDERASCVEVRVPARPEMWGLMRMAVSTVASGLAMSVEKIEDLRIAVDELCTLCAIGAGAETELRLVIRVEAGAIEASCTATGLAGSPAAEPSDLPDGFTPAELSERILEALVDDFGLSPTTGATRQGWFLSRT
ncbi:MAG: ATP-binding protein [Acidimicrobiales bacterium]